MIGLSGIRNDLLARIGLVMRGCGSGRPLLSVLSRARLGWEYGNSFWFRFRKDMLSRIGRVGKLGLYGAFRDAPYSTVGPLARDIFCGLWAKESSDRLGRLFSSGVFYLCSSHSGPARDHSGYEGRMYVSRYWRKRTPKELLPQVEDYIRAHDCRIAEWVVGKPVYLCTRPNCRHYLREVPIRKALSYSAEELLRAYGMYMRSVPKISYSEQMRRKYAFLARGAEILGDAAGYDEGDYKKYRRLEKAWK